MAEEVEVTCPSEIHGVTPWAYRRGCRCLAAVEAHRVHRREQWHRRYRRTHPIRGTPRRRGDGHVDGIAVELACIGRRVELTIPERAEAVRRLTGRGLSSREIAERLYVCERTVQRYRRRDVNAAYEAKKSEIEHRKKGS